MTLSYWERTTLLQYDYVVIGAGIVGLSTAISLKEMNPSYKVLVIERGVFPTGASTKNAGFACFGSLSELVADVEAFGEETMLALVEKRWAGLNLLRGRLGDTTIDYQSHGGYELIGHNELHFLDHLQAINTQLKPIFKDEVFSLQDDKITKFGLSKKHTQHLVYNPFEGQIDTGKMMDALWHKAGILGVRVMNNTTVVAIESNEVLIKDNNAEGEVRIVAGQIAICTNAFSRQFLPNEDIVPGRGLVLVTQPMQKVPFEGVFHFEEGYYYFRNINNRVLFGGGRNVDFEGEKTTEQGTNPIILADLKQKLQEVILPNQSYEIDQYWSGIMAFGATKKPLMKRVNANTVVGVRLGGMGVAIGSVLGRDVAELMVG
jgi:glycine/D-amino acid oxidase-like deaminating enzyme